MNYPSTHPFSQFLCPKSENSRYVYLCKRSKPKAEFAEVDTFFTNRYPSLRIFFTKKIWKSKKLGHFYYSSYKSCILGILEANFFSKKVSYSANSA